MMKLLTNPSVVITYQYEYQGITLYILHFTKCYMSIISVKLKNGRYQFKLCVAIYSYTTILESKEC